MFPFASTASHDRQLEASIPGESGLPLVGHTFQFLYSPVATALHFYQKHGPVFWVRSLGITSVALMGPEANQLVLRNEGDAFSNNQGWEFFIGKFFKRGIMLLDFEEHRFHRGIMQAAFKKPQMVEYLGRMNPAIARGLGRWRSGPGFEVLTELKQLTLDIATEVFMGERLGPEADRINKAFVDCVLAGTSIVRYPVPGGRWRRGLQGRRVLKAFFRARIAHKRANPGNDLFSRLCQAEDEDGRRFSDDDVINHMIFLMMAAHDTTTLTLCSMMYQLAKHPDWQERLRREAFSLGKPTLDHEDIGTMEDMGLVMKESIRLLSPVHGLPRRTVKDVEFKGHVIPKGSYVVVSPIVTHRLPDWWRHPEAFDPERFSEARAEHKKHPYLFIPFGGGAHMCIGLHFAEMEVKAILHQLLQHFRWSVPAGYEMPVNFTTLPSPADRLPVRLERL
jgi:cytochrome P450